MRVMIAPDSFKGSLDAIGVARAMARGVLRVDPTAEVDLCPIADGGEGTVAALVAASGGEIRHAQVIGPLDGGGRVRATWGWLGGGRAVVELAEAAGLSLVPEDLRDPLKTTTYGVGRADPPRPRRGGRPTSSWASAGRRPMTRGLGMAQALGVRLFTQNGELRTPPAPAGTCSASRGSTCRASIRGSVRPRCMWRAM